VVLASISALAVQLEKEYKITTIGLTATSDITTENIRHESNIMFPFYYCDATTLKTMVRSNPGVLLIQNGVIINKWAFRALPSAKEIATQINK
jgi:SRSO17 transposase